MKLQNYSEELFSIKTENDFERLALKVFHHQSEHNPVYAAFINGLRIQSAKINSVSDIPFLPVEFFRTHKILSSSGNYEKIFTSSGTTADQASKHFVTDIKLYEDVFKQIFTQFYGSSSDYVILALLPSYLEREGSSLIYMMEKLIAQSNKKDSGFYLNEYEKLFSLLKELKQKRVKTILFGVTYALLDFVAEFPIDFPELIVMETGGMKGKRKEMVRAEVHEILCKGFGVNAIHSEYGMTELLSQAYSSGEGIFKTPSWMKIIIRDPYDPLKSLTNNSSGGINIIDLANINSCAFIATQDLGKVYDDGTFEVIGRFDFSEVRGCNLMIED